MCINSRDLFIIGYNLSHSHFSIKTIYIIYNKHFLLTHIIEKKFIKRILDKKLKIKNQWIIKFKNLYRNQSSFSLDLAPIIQEFFLDEESRK